MSDIRFCGEWPGTTAHDEVVGLLHTVTDAYCTMVGRSSMPDLYIANDPARDTPFVAWERRNGRIVYLDDWKAHCPKQLRPCVDDLKRLLIS